MDLSIPFPSLTPSTLLSFSPQTSLPLIPASERHAPLPRKGRPLAERRLPLPVRSVNAPRRGFLDDTPGRGEEVVRRCLEGLVEDLSDQEERVYRADQNIRVFGEDFLLPVGRRQTARETQQTRSETPSTQGDHTAPQEDQDQDNNADGAAEGGGEGQAGGEGDSGGEGDDSDEGERDLDASMEDRDRSDSGDGDGDESGGS